MSRTFSLEAGALVRFRVRAALDAALKSGAKIEWNEQKGLLESIFVVSGRSEDIHALSMELNALSASAGREHGPA